MPCRQLYRPSDSFTATKCQRAIYNFAFFHSTQLGYWKHFQNILTDNGGTGGAGRVNGGGVIGRDLVSFYLESETHLRRFLKVRQKKV